MLFSIVAAPFTLPPTMQKGFHFFTSSPVGVPVLFCFIVAILPVVRWFQLCFLEGK